MAVLAGATVWRVTSAGPGTAVFIDAPDIRLDGLRPGQHQAVVWVRNASGRRLRVVGLNDVCGQNCCLGPPPGDLVTLDPHAVTAVPIVLVTPTTGPFSAGTTLFVEDIGGVRRFVLTVAGSVSTE